MRMSVQGWLFRAACSTGASAAASLVKERRVLDGQSAAQLSLDAVAFAGEASHGCGDPGPSTSDGGLIAVSGSETGVGCLEGNRTWFQVFRGGEAV